MELTGNAVPVWRLAAAGCYLALGAAVLVAVWPGARSRSAAAPAGAPPVASALRFPAPPRGATVLARQEGADVVAAALLRRGSSLDVQVSVVGGQGAGVSGRSVRVGGVVAAACGRGCYRATVPARGVLPIVVGRVPWRVQVPAASPPGGLLVLEAQMAWRSLKSLSWTETLGSDATHVVQSEWTAQAPDRVAYVVHDGGASVVIGRRRWDRAPSGTWRSSTQDPPLRQPVPFWTGAVDAHVVARTAGRATVTFYDPGTPGWFRVVLDTSTWRTLQMDMYATAHFMHDRYSRFDESAVVAPR